MNEMRKILPVVFFSSMAALAFEVLLTRIFSISLWYHFAFMIISIAMLGLAAGGTLLSMFSRLRDMKNIGPYTFCLGIAIPAGYLLANLVPFDPVRLSWERTEILHLGLYYLFLALPFFFSGLIIATALTAGSDRSGLLYGADLLGAGIGSLGILFLMGMIAPERGVFVLSSVVLGASFLVCGKSLKAASLILIAANIALFSLQPEFTRLRISPYKELPAALRYPGAEPMRTYYTPFARIDTFRSPAVRFAPGLSLSYLEPLPEQIGFAVDGGNTSAITHAADRAALRFLAWLPAALPYETGQRNNILILDPGGGLQMLLAHYYRAVEVIGIETNPWLAGIIRKDFGSFSGNIYGTKTRSGLGRSWLVGRSETFDLIDISLQDAAPAGSFGIAEDYRYTVEAFREYVSHLRNDGAVCVNLFIIPPPRNELRILATLAAAMESLGIRNPGQHIAAVRSWGSVSILAKRSPLTRDETAAVRRFARQRRFDTVFLPDITPQETNRYIKMPSNEYFRAFAAILSPEKRKSFMEEYVFDVGPVYDNAPFFHYFLKFGKIREVYRIMGGKWQFFLEEGYIVPALLVQAAVLSALLVLLPAFAAWDKRNDEPNTGSKMDSPLIREGIIRVKAASGHLRGKNGTGLLPYFAFLGFGFMFVEITLIQKLILPLENPSYAMAAVLATLLLSSGAGSLLSFRYAVLGSSRIIALTALVIILYGFFLPAVSAVIAHFRSPASFILVCLALFPSGFLMGIPFPTGLKVLGRRNPHLIPWAWAINGCCSVLGPLCAVFTAMELGFRNVLLLGALFYFFAFLNMVHFIPNKTVLTQGRKDAKAQSL
jgi:hypothetical protein